MIEKLTYNKAINFALRALNGENLPEADKIAVAEKLIALGQSLEKRNANRSDKPTKKQVENGNVKAQILSVLSGEGKRCKDIADAVGISSQKCSALLIQLVNTEQVEKYEEKRVSYFRLKDADDPVQALPGEITY